MRRFGHGHSFAGGVIITLLVQRNGWLVLVGALLIFAAGLVAGRAWSFWTDAARALKAKLLRSKFEKIPATPTPVYSMPGAGRGRAGVVASSGPNPLIDDDERTAEYWPGQRKKEGR